MTTTWTDPRWPQRRRNLGAWGFADESYPPSDELLAWLRERIGPATARPRSDLSEDRLPAPRRLPDLGTDLATDDLDRLVHSRGQGLPDLLRLRAGAVPALPDAVARPADAGQVRELIHRCARRGVKVVPWGGGSSVTGGVNVPRLDAPVVVLDLARLSGLRTLDAESGLATFGAGTLGPEVEAALAPHGLTLGHFPQSWELSTLGGWVATRSSGQESLGYGRIEDLVAGVELVAPGGELSLPPLPASAAGPDLRHLVLGSEGRFGVITRATVRVSRRPEHHRVEGALLPDWEAGLAASRRLVREGHPLLLLRLSDVAETEVALALGLGRHPLGSLVERWLSWRGVADGCLLLTGAGGAAAAVRRTLAAARSVVRDCGGVSLGQSPGRHWTADRFRHPYLRDGLLALGIATDTLETAAPWSRLPKLTRVVREALESGLEGDREGVAVLCHLSHPYPDGASLYFTFFFRHPGDVDAAVARWARLKRAATGALVNAGGTLSHHHGVGRWHAPWLEREVGRDGMRVLAATAATLDPEGVLNPQVLLDPVDRLEA